MSDAGASLTGAGHRPDGYPAFCGQLLARAKSYYPATTLTCDETARPANPVNLRVGGKFQSAGIRKQVRPEYPREARSRGIQGAVRFETTIGTDGMMRLVELLSGPLILYKSARDAVLQWEYSPTLLNGKPTEVITTIDVNFALSR